MSSFLLKLAGLLLLLTALALTLSRAPDRPVETLVAAWALPPSDFIEVKGQVVHVRDEGPREDPLPVVLLHGTSASLHTWEGWVKALRSRHRVITLDLPGFGLTGPFAGRYDPADYRGDTYARFVLDVLDALQVQRVVIGGNGLGGEIAWRVAALAPERTERLILVAASGLQAVPDAVPMAMAVSRVRALGWLFERALPRPLVAQALAELYGHPERVTPDLVDRYFELTLRTGNRRALGERLRSTEPAEHGDRLKALQLPTLVLWGGLDRVLPPALARRFQEAIPGSRIVSFDDLGHLPQEEDAPRTVQAVLDFLAPGGA